MADFAHADVSEDDFLNATKILLDEEYDVVLDEGGARFFKFTPEEEGTYRFYSFDNDGDPRAFMYTYYGGSYEFFPTAMMMPEIRISR